MKKIIIVLVLIVATVGGYVVGRNQPSGVLTSRAPQQIHLERPPLTFQIPRGYAVFQTEGFEGGYGTVINILEEKKDSYFQPAPLTITLGEYLYDQSLKVDILETYQTMDEYLEARMAHEGRDVTSQPHFITLFGNKALRYTSAADGTPTVVGYIEKSEKNKNGDTVSSFYLVNISSNTYGSGLSLKEDLFEMVVRTLAFNPDSEPLDE